MLRAELIGNLGDDAHLVEGDFKAFTAMSVANSSKYKKNDGTVVESTMWVNVTINWDCSKLRPYLLKGTKVYVSGKMKCRYFTRQNGDPSVGVDIIADSIELCGTKAIDTQTKKEDPEESKAKMTINKKTNNKPDDPDDTPF